MCLEVKQLKLAMEIFVKSLVGQITIFKITERLRGRVTTMSLILQLFFPPSPCLTPPVHPIILFFSSHSSASQSLPEKRAAGNFEGSKYGSNERLFRF